MTNHKITEDFYLEHTYSGMPEVKNGDTITIIEKQKVVDLSKVVGTRIPMLFQDKRGIDYPHYANYLNYCFSVSSYETSDLQTYPICKFDTSPGAWVSWGPHVSWYMGKCPLPDGVEYEVVFANGSKDTTYDWIWGRDECDKEGAIIAFRITGLKDGWVYPWEMSDD